MPTCKLFPPFTATCQSRLVTRRQAHRLLRIRERRDGKADFRVWLSFLFLAARPRPYQAEVNHHAATTTIVFGGGGLCCRFPRNTINYSDVSGKERERERESEGSIEVVGNAGADGKPFFSSSPCSSRGRLAWICFIMSHALTLTHTLFMTESQRWERCDFQVENYSETSKHISSLSNF